MNLEITSIPFLALYAETHFRFFRFFPSLLYKRQPEIFFDMPKRIDPGEDIPVMLILNDIDKFPVDICEVILTLSQKGTSTIIFSKKDVSQYVVTHPFGFQSQVYLFTFPHTIADEGPFSVNGKIIIKIKNRSHVILNDNLKGSSKGAFTSRKAKTKLPGHEWCRYGDLHTHSQHSRSHIEFGPPISIIDTMAKTCGLSFIGITDHSYDLACKMDDYLVPDSTLQSWQSLKNEITRNQAHYGTAIILGEEVSACNARNKVVHIGALDIEHFISGSKDGARKIKKTSNPTIQEAVSNIAKQGGLSFAAHPGAKSGILQRALLKRGMWSIQDIPKNIHAFQAVNNGFSPSWFRARKLWISLLLSQQKLPLIAGNDAHGDFNRYRSVKVPFLSIYESTQRYFADVVTGIYTTDESKDSVITAIKMGRTFITDGPFLTITSTDNPKDSLVSHTEYPLENRFIFITGISSEESGVPHLLRVFRGEFSSKIEKIEKIYTYKSGQYSIVEKLDITADMGPGYIRAEFICLRNDKTETMAVTSPCYLR